MTAIAQLRNKAAFVQAWRIAKAAGPDTRLLWRVEPYEVVDGPEARRRFRAMLDRRITSRGHPTNGSCTG